MNKDIWVYIEQIEGKIANVSLELLGEAVKLKRNMQEPGQVVALIIGSQVKEAVNVVMEYGAERVYLANDSRLALYCPEYYAAIVERLIKEYDPHIFLIGASYLGSHLGPMVAAKRKTGIAAHCVELKIDNQDNLVAVVPAFGGRVLGDILCPKHRPQMASVKPGILERPEKTETKGEIVEVDRSFLEEINPSLRPLNLWRVAPKGVPLEEAEIVFCGGWGIGDQEHWQLLEKIAERLGGSIASTRPPVDEGWSEGENVMVGTSGKSIRPKIYLGFGISGATHHSCGMKDSGLIINTNKDQKAEIFNISDYGIVGDIREVLPLLAAELGIN